MLSFIVQLSHPYMTTGKTIALTRRTFVDKVMSLLFNMLSRLFIASKEQWVSEWKSLSRVRLLATPWTTAYQAPPSMGLSRQDNPRQSIKKQRHHFANKGPSRQGCGFPVVMYGCESWTINKAEHRRIDAFKLWCWRRLLRVPWTATRSNQSILKEISPEYLLERLMLKLKL